MPHGVGDSVVCNSVVSARDASGLQLHACARFKAAC